MSLPSPRSITHPHSLMPGTFRNKRRRVAKSTAMLRRKRVRRVNNRLKRYVHAAMSRAAENKTAYNTFNQTSFNGAATAAGDLIATMPAIQEGPASYQRDGNSILVKKMVTKGYIRWGANTFSEEGPIYATLWLVIDKMQRSFAYTSGVTPSGTYPSDIYYCLYNTLNQPTNPTGDWREAVSKLRSDRFKIVRKRIKLAPNYSSQSTTTPFANYGAGEGQFFRPFTMVTPIRKGGQKWHYATDAAAYPENFNTYMFVSFAGPGAPTGYGSLSNVQLNLSCNTVVDYEDI